MRTPPRSAAEVLRGVWFLLNCAVRACVGAWRALALRLLRALVRRSDPRDPRAHWTLLNEVWNGSARSVVRWGQEQLWRDERLYTTVRWLSHALATPAYAFLCLRRGLVRRTVPSAPGKRAWRADLLLPHPQPATIPFEEMRWVLYLHGGGYSAGTAATTAGIAAQLMAALDRCGGDGAASPAALPSAAMLLEYRCAPEHRFPAAVEDAVQAYDWLRERAGAHHVVVAGDSAGGGLAVALLLALQCRARPVELAAGLAPLGLAGVEPAAVHAERTGRAERAARAAVEVEAAARADALAAPRGLGAESLPAAVIAFSPMLDLRWCAGGAGRADDGADSRAGGGGGASARPSRSYSAHCERFDCIQPKLARGCSRNYLRSADPGHPLASPALAPPALLRLLAGAPAGSGPAATAVTARGGEACAPCAPCSPPLLIQAGGCEIFADECRGFAQRAAAAGAAPALQVFEGQTHVFQLHAGAGALVTPRAAEALMAAARFAATALDDAAAIHRDRARSPSPFVLVERQ